MDIEQGIPMAKAGGWMKLNLQKIPDQIRL